MTRGDVTSEDIVREYLARLTLYDRNGPTFRALLALNPRAIADARASRRGARRRARAQSVPRRADRLQGQHRCDGAADHRRVAGPGRSSAAPRFARRRRHEARRRGRPRQGQPRRVPVRRFRHQHASAARSATPTIRRSAPPVRAAAARRRWPTSLAALGFGTDTCNSLSNPCAFASLATIRVTRGLASRAGVMPLNTYNDAVGPMAKSVRDVALALDLVDRHRRRGSRRRPTPPRTSTVRSRPGFDSATLKGKRIGALRQRFVGFTGEREVAANMDRVIKELAAAGATVVDVAIADYDAKYAAARGSAPGSLKAGMDRLPVARREARRQGAHDRRSARVRQAGAGQRAPIRRRARADADRRGAGRSDASASSPGAKHSGSCSST